MFKIGLFFLLAAGAFSCGRIENSSSQDKATYEPRVGGSALHETVISILSAKCTPCHASWLAYSDAQFVSNGLVIGHDPTGSKIYFRNQLGPGPSNNMPQGGGAAATASEMQTISDWINSIN